MIAAYIFSEKQSGRIYDFSNGNHFDLDTVSAFAYTSILSDGYDAIFGASGVSYATSSTFALPGGQQALSLCLKIKCATPPGSGSTYVLLQQGSEFGISINSSGYIVFSVTGTGGGTTTTFTKTSSVNICDGNYHSIVCVANGTTLQIYTDGIPETTTTAAVYTTLTTSSSLLIIGSSSSGTTSPYYQGNMSYVIISQYALSANDAANLAASPQKGINFQTQSNSYQIGDVISDPSDTVQGVVIWSPDGLNVNILPYTPFMEVPFARVGNIYNTARQYLMTTVNDFDGNGNGQIAISGPITSINDYNSPANKQTWDYTGLNNVPQIDFDTMAACLIFTNH